MPPKLPCDNDAFPVSSPALAADHPGDRFFFKVGVSTAPGQRYLSGAVSLHISQDSHALVADLMSQLYVQQQAVGQWVTQNEALHRRLAAQQNLETTAHDAVRRRAPVRRGNCFFFSSQNQWQSISPVYLRGVFLCANFCIYSHLRHSFAYRHYF